MTGAMTAAILTAAVIAAAALVALAVLSIDPEQLRREPEFPCIRCACCSYVADGGEFHRTCEGCMSGIDGEPVTCLEARGTAACRRNARRR